ncbi:MAG: PDZ domain-containing protein [Gammaproteobacteria bacterium]|nr:PDZ domain-containing protein [Gammaproteobacteria bacterium]NIP46901.1 serine protease [Gammaproteobacteria bacterium]NIP64771.1 PDZ domain-containing protein [Gammaproteobacteria bacterium]NIP89069.1 serine protease [Gammaproteobacteria bacterium]NIQ27107.1 PDZ domain-containing protein [Gammaproteobacteria bacterium]
MKSAAPPAVSLFLAAALATNASAAPLALDEVLAPVVALEARIPDNARSAATLGTVRGGTGVVIDATGLVLTIGYLILEAASVEILPDGLAGERVPADVVAWDQITGLGLVRARRALAIEPMPLAASATLAAGDAAIAVSWERTNGMLPALVVARRPYAGFWEYMIEDAIYVSPSHPGFPGAALITLDGKLAGIGGFAVADVEDEYAVSGSVFIPIDALDAVLADLLLSGRSSQARGWLGLYCEEVQGTLQVRRVPADGPALRAGVQPGDRVKALAGSPVSTLPDFYRRLWATTRPGDRVAIELQRGTESFTVEIEAMDRYQRYLPSAPQR